MGSRDHHRGRDGGSVLKTLGKYQVTGEIGRGAMGIIYRGHDPILERDVALKTMMSPHGSVDEMHRERFYREARAAGRLHHRNIVAIYDLGEDEGVPYIAMELLTGFDLQQRIAAGPISILEAIEITAQVAEGLAYAQEFGIVHRDIKPANIFITTSGTAKILDFGIAKLVASEMTQTGVVIGSFHYMSPEQIRASRSVDGRSDLFSLGVILHELLSGQKPFPGESMAQVMYRIVYEEPADVATLCSASPALAAVVSRSLRKEPESRYQTGGEFAAALWKLAAGLTDRTSSGQAGLQAHTAVRLAEARQLLEASRAVEAAAIVNEILRSQPDHTGAVALLSLIPMGLVPPDVVAPSEPGEDAPTHVALKPPVAVTTPTEDPKPPDVVAPAEPGEDAPTHVALKPPVAVTTPTANWIPTYAPGSSQTDIKVVKTRLPALPPAASRRRLFQIAVPVVLIGASGLAYLMWPRVPHSSPPPEPVQIELQPELPKQPQVSDQKAETNLDQQEPRPPAPEPQPKTIPAGTPDPPSSPVKDKPPPSSVPQTFQPVVKLVEGGGHSGTPSPAPSDANRDVSNTMADRPHEVVTVPALVLTPTSPNPPPKSTADKPSEIPDSLGRQDHDDSALRIELEREEIRQLFRLWESAQKNLNADGVKQVFPSANADDIRKTFTDLKSQQVSMQEVEIFIDSSSWEATARFMVTFSYVPKAGSKKSAPAREMVWRLTRGNAGWEIRESVK